MRWHRVSCGESVCAILAIGTDGAFVVIDLKVSRGHDRPVCQLLRYMAWVRDKLSKATRWRPSKVVWPSCKVRFRERPP